MNTIPFTVEDALAAIWWGTGKIVTRRGYNVQITAWNVIRGWDDRPLLLGRIPEHEDEGQFAWYTDGTCYKDRHRCPNDLLIEIL
jgi:hypothetical protein